MDQYVRLIVDTLRRTGKTDDALRAYCWAKSAVPIELTPGEDPFKAPRASSLNSINFVADAIDAGATDEQLEAAFYAGCQRDKEQGVALREMLKHEKPTSGDLYNAMSPDSRREAFVTFGVRPVLSSFAPRYR